MATALHISADTDLRSKKWSSCFTRLLKSDFDIDVLMHIPTNSVGNVVTTFAAYESFKGADEEIYKLFKNLRPSDLNDLMLDLDLIDYEICLSIAAIINRLKMVCKARFLNTIEGVGFLT